MAESTILIAIVALIIGGVIGYLMAKSSSEGDSQERRVQELQDEIKEYKASVASHFQQTASMINEMNESYKGVIHHLASGSQDLCDAGTAKEIESRLAPQQIEAKPVEAAPEQREPQREAVEPPRDYAPKKENEEGALSENYGVKPVSAETKEEEQAPKQQDPNDIYKNTP
ncbi:MAG: YhcB family protein [Pseudomonadales bacterium]